MVSISIYAKIATFIYILCAAGLYLMDKTEGEFGVRSMQLRNSIHRGIAGYCVCREYFRDMCPRQGPPLRPPGIEASAWEGLTGLAQSLCFAAKLGVSLDEIETERATFERAVLSPHGVGRRRVVGGEPAVCVCCAAPHR
jgi:hypothetical protein